MKTEREMQPLDRVLHDPLDGTSNDCPECAEPWPCAERRRQREDRKWVYRGVLDGALFKRTDDRPDDPEGVRTVDPLGWSVWWSYGLTGLLVTIRRPDGELHASTDHGSMEWLLENLP